MASTTQAQALSASVQQLWSDGISMTIEGLEASQAHSKKLLENTFDLAAAAGKDCLKCAEELRGHLTEAANYANEKMRGQASLLNDLPNDPMGASQRMISGYVDGSRKSMDIGAGVMKSYLNMVNEVWSRMEQVSQETRENYAEYLKRLQGIVESKTKKD